LLQVIGDVQHFVQHKLHIAQRWVVARHGDVSLFFG
jgi:hypothetical protein